MLTIKTIENIKFGSKITLFNGIYVILLGIYYALFSDLIMTDNFRAFDSFWSFFTRYNSKIGLLFTKNFILMGLFMIAIGICIIYFSMQISKKKEKIDWVILFIIGILFWSGLFIIELFNINLYTIILSFIGWLSFIIGMIIPIRYYIEKPYDSY